ncbi:hypothetical protein BOTBODRAFT_69133 [Botryobasidium botryosum FD-172 SS1]|uniref:Uncharacterized protein n=1 Tax=Botryobasidium botryosum (strain FD-172 SS1) TaxID=930990 RepID=A0A067MC38_BOTB1|nr:hypothetical protein BOTBODRAFT_69133 [Botryobasidium botryosum FD-172 SS1]
MTRVQQLFEAALALSQRLTANDIPHAFHGGILALALGSPQPTEEIICVVEGGFRRVRVALEGSEELTTMHSTWTDRLFASYNEPIPKVVIEIKNAGEEGPRNLNSATVMSLQHIPRVPFLTVSEFLRAKLKAWNRGDSAEDARDIIFILQQHGQSVDINRILDQDVDRFVGQFPDASEAWVALQQRFGL